MSLLAKEGATFSQCSLINLPSKPPLGCPSPSAARPCSEDKAKLHSYKAIRGRAESHFWCNSSYKTDLQPEAVATNHKVHPERNSVTDWHPRSPLGPRANDPTTVTALSTGTVSV